MSDKQSTHVRRTVTVGVVALVLLGFVAGTVGTVGATDSGAAQADSGAAQLRVAHLSPDAPAVDVLIDGEAVLEGVEFGTVSDYLQLSAGTYQVTIQTSENETTVFDGELSVEAGTMYTVAAIGEVGADTFEVSVFVDDFEQPSAENASVRLVHASPDAPAVDVTVAESGAVLYDNVTFGNATDYATVPAGDYTLEVRPATETDDGEVVATFNVSLEGGTAYSAIAAGYLAPDQAIGDEPFDLLVAVDSTGDAMAGNETTTEEM